MADPATKRSDELRQQGNRKYTEKDYKAAIKFYEEARTLTPADAAIPSNLAASFYELGMYDKALLYSQRTIDLLEKAGEDPKKLRRKNLIRLARIYYMVSPQKKDLKGFARAAFKQTDLEQTDDNEELVAIHNQIQAFINDDSVPKHEKKERDVFTNLPRLHSTKTPSVREYYTFGHDTASSILFHYDERMADRENKGIRISQHPKLSFFFGGVGDARNVMMSLSDINRQVTQEGGSSMDISSIKIDFVLNDVLNTSIARSILVFMICEELGQYSYDDLQKKKEAANLSALLYYIYLGVVMPETLYLDLVKRIKSFIQMGDNGQLPSWIVISPATWKSVRKSLAFWISDDFHASTRWLLRTFAPEIDNSFLDGLDDQVRNDQYKLGQKLGEEYKNQLPIPVQLENFFMKSFKILYPPDQCDAGTLHPKLKTLMEELKSKSKVNDKSAKQMMEDIAATWKPNLTCIDQKWNINNTSSNLHFDPILVADNCFNDAWMTKRLREKATAAKSKVATPTLFEFFIQDFYQCGQAIHRLGKSGHLVMEFDVNEMHDTLAMISDKKREASSLPIMFDRIHLSNVTDHTGYITPFTEIAQLLKRKDYSYICFAILLNVSFWKDMNELVYSYTGIQNIGDFPKYLGFKKLYGDLFTEYTYWQPVDSPKELATKEEITQWIFNLFVNFGIPAPMNPSQICIINSPNNLSAIFKVLTRLNEIGYPIHWLTSILESLLCGAINTTATIPGQRVIKYIKQYMRKYNILPWQLELSTLTGLWTERHGIRINSPTAIYKVPYPGQVQHYRIPIQMINEFIPFSGGSVIVSTLVAVIEYPSMPSDRKIQRFDPMDFDSSPFDDTIRNSLVEIKHANWLQIVSVCSWNDVTRQLDFWMSKVEFQKLTQLGCTVAVFRNDSWRVISNSSSLTNATVISDK
ncbi:hypothetical protein DFA_08636 [Cavenderia fasciculata]|uniref:DUF4470 domain-containing protein n=1 Tax=Cavenderia fasciculata TaxID=261658 RepID=F4Q3D0_CACFS|nr:uncharacterized protein DFA_08636 [Cavenderia fasciculata]EGG17640.1 hypothetical protein DFA_08636 [Cavenderia fasciculata]|eukprot:XP_004356124.1 hypothetical protein DFA_08636 [Cavenderia fasciculata]